MNKKRFLLLASILALILATGAFFARRSIQKMDTFADSASSSSEASAEGAAVSSGASAVGASETSGDPWEVYVEHTFQGMLKALRDHGIELDAENMKQIRANLVEQAEAMKASGVSVSELPDPIKGPYTLKEISIPPRQYTGPQTVEALMAEFDADMIAIHGLDENLDEQYPRKEWIQRLLDRGAVINDLTDYQIYVQGLRQRVLHYARKDKRIEEGDPRASWMTPAREWFGLSEDVSWDDVVDAVIDKELRKWPETKQQFRNDELTGKKTLRVHIDDGAFFARGDLRGLSEEQLYALEYRGVAPKGYNIVYVDEKDNPLAPSPNGPPRNSHRKYIDSLSEEQARRLAERLSNMDPVKASENWSAAEWMMVTDMISAFLDEDAPAASAPPLAPKAITSGGNSAAPSVSAVGENPSLSAVGETSAPSVSVEKGPSPFPPDMSNEKIAAYYELLNRHIQESGDLTRAQKQVLELQYEAYQRWEKQRRLRKQEDQESGAAP